MDSYQWHRGSVPGAMPARCTFPPSPLHSVRLHTSTRQMPAVPLVTPHPGRPLLLKLCSPSRQAPLVIPLSSPSPAPLLTAHLSGLSQWEAPGGCRVLAALVKCPLIVYHSRKSPSALKWWPSFWKFWLGIKTGFSSVQSLSRV